MITGTTTTSMMAVALSRISRSADAIGPCGSSTPAPRQEPARHASTRAVGRKNDFRSTERTDRGCPRYRVPPVYAGDGSIPTVSERHRRLAALDELLR